MVGVKTHTLYRDLAETVAKLIEAKKYIEAADACRAMIQVDPNFSSGYTLLSFVLLRAGDTVGGTNASVLGFERLQTEVKGTKEDLIHLNDSSQRPAYVHDNDARPVRWLGGHQNPGMVER